MKKQHSLIKQIGLTIYDALVEVVDVTRYWNYVLYGEMKGFVMDAFTVQVAGAINDFEWEADEISPGYNSSSSPSGSRMEVKYRARPVAENHHPSDNFNKSHRDDHSEKVDTPIKKKKAQNIILRPVKVILRFIFITVPEAFTTDKGRHVEPEVMENRIRSK